MNRREFILALEDIGACYPSIEWVRETKGKPRELWHKCKRGDWLLWLARHMGLAPGGVGVVLERIQSQDDEELVAHTIRAVVPFEAVEARMLAQAIKGESKR